MKGNQHGCITATFLFFFPIAVYSDQPDTSSYSESDYSYSSKSSMISDFGEAPLSSTRRSSFFNLSNINGRPNDRVSYNRLFDMDTKRHHRQDGNDSSSHWASEGPSVLSSTRMSAVGPDAPMPVLKEGDVFTTDDVFLSNANEDAATTESRISAHRRDIVSAFPSMRASRKSVSFRDVDEYFPVFSPDSPKQQPAADDSHCTKSLPFNLSEYSGFLDLERMATILHQQGIDVTSPDHVYVFCRESNTGTEQDMEKTVISHWTLDESHDEQESEQQEDNSQLNIQPLGSCGGSSSSETASSQYSSCESDHYTSALEASIHPRKVSLPATEEVLVGAESAKNSDSILSRQDEKASPVQTEPPISSTSEYFPHILEKLTLSDKNTIASMKSEDCVDDTGSKASKENVGLPLTPSPFVTGRTRSRLSRCSQRTRQQPESLLFTSSLFDETLPTPSRTHRQTPRSHSSDDQYKSPHAPCDTPSSLENSTEGGCLAADHLNIQSSTLSSVNSSQADTLILSKSKNDTAAESQTLCDTLIVEKNPDTSVDAYERNLAEVRLAMQQRLEGAPAENGDFLTDDLTSADETSAKGGGNDAAGVFRVDKSDDWITEDCMSQSDPTSSSSSSSYFSPRRSREDSDLPCTPGTGCTPRYSMSRLSSCRRAQHLANLSYTPGGRPVIQDLDEPVEYLYTDTEQGHKLIETHVPPTANTSLGSSMSTTSSEETIIYDWRSMHTDMMSKIGKENQEPQMLVQKEKGDEEAQRVLPEIRGMTDKELRLRLVQLGERPGPINSHTRATYIRRLSQLLHESKSKKPLQPQKQLDQAQTGNTTNY